MPVALGAAGSGAAAGGGAGAGIGAGGAGAGAGGEQAASSAKPPSGVRAMKRRRVV
jgi:hypothetical protein